MIPVFRPSLGEDELSALHDVFASGWIGQGPKAAEFEKLFAERVGVPHAVGVNCCSNALYLAVRLLDLKPGDEVLLPSWNFIACAHAVSLCGGTPVFCDIDERTLMITPDEIEERRTSKTRSVIVTHYGGRAAPMDRIMEAAQGLSVIEDAAHTAGYSALDGQPCGSFGFAGCFSFDAVKHISMGDGGLVTLQNAEMAERARSLRYLGIDKTTYDGLASRKERWWQYNVREISPKMQMNDIAATIGLMQMSKLEKSIERRREISNLYDEAFERIGWLRTPLKEDERHRCSYFIYWLDIDNGLRDRFAGYLVENGVFCTMQYYPNHMLECYQNLNTGELPVTERMKERVITIPLHQALSNDDVQSIIDFVYEFDRLHG